MIPCNNSKTQSCCVVSNLFELKNNRNSKKAYYREVECFNDDVVKCIPVIDMRRTREENLELHYQSTYKRDYKPPCLLRHLDCVQECCCVKKYYERVIPC